MKKDRIQTSYERGYKSGRIMGIVIGILITSALFVLLIFLTNWLL